jgi:hypothetical protein
MAASTAPPPMADLGSRMAPWVPFSMCTSSLFAAPWGLAKYFLSTSFPDPRGSTFLFPHWEYDSQNTLESLEFTPLPNHTGFHNWRLVDPTKSRLILSSD